MFKAFTPPLYVLSVLGFSYNPSAPLEALVGSGQEAGEHSGREHVPKDLHVVRSHLPRLLSSLCSDPSRCLYVLGRLLCRISPSRRKPVSP
jgi:hypothetical protein